MTTTKSRIHVPDISRHKIEKLQVGPYDAVYLDDSVREQIIWVVEDSANGSAMQYEIRASGVDEQWMRQIAIQCNSANPMNGGNHP